jgi:hypothetical protein
VEGGEKLGQSPMEAQRPKPHPPGDWLLFPRRTIDGRMAGAAISADNLQEEVAVPL